jgi:hypothetical protein
MPDGPRWAAWLALVTCTAAGCSIGHRIDVTPPGAPQACLDGRPVRLLQDARCQDGICGYTCAPDRWTPRPGCPDF